MTDDTSADDDRTCEAPTGRTDPDHTPRVPGDGLEVRGDDGAVRCPYCHRPFTCEQYRDLHVGLAHETEMDDGERDRFSAAYEDEREALRMFQLKALAALVALYFGFLFAFSILG